MHVRIDDLTDPRVLALLQEHLANMHEITPAEHIYALDLGGLKAPDVTFYTVWDGETLLGCGALKQLSSTHGEVKSMRTPWALRRRGAGRAVLLHILAEARNRGYERVSLETGSAAAFSPAHALYHSCGFTPCGAFGDYQASPDNVFMSLAL